MLEQTPPLAQCISAFCFGVLLSPLSWGLLFFIAFIIVYELIYCYGCSNYFACTAIRVAVIFYAIFGWIVGRTVTDLDVLESGKNNLTLDAWSYNTWK
jgi:hypothetical protein